MSNNTNPKTQWLVIVQIGALICNDIIIDDLSRLKLSDIIQVKSAAHVSRIEKSVVEL